MCSPLCRKQFSHQPNVIRNPRFHRGSAADRGVDAHEVIPCNPERKAGFVIRQLAAVCIRSADVTTKMGSYAKVESFDMTSAHKTRLGASASDTWDSSRNPARGTVPIGPGYVGARIELDELREMDARGEVRIYSVNVG